MNSPLGVGAVTHCNRRDGVSEGLGGRLIIIFGLGIESHNIITICLCDRNWSCFQSTVFIFH
jgi:hypothetical protein